MRRFVGSVGIGALSLCCALGQGPMPPAFDVATVKPNRTGKGGANLAASPGTLTIRNLPLDAIIEAAYGVAKYQISGPRWIEQERFDILAKTDGSVTKEDEMLPLLQPLLGERFHLTLHRETRQLPAYVLTVATNGPKLEAAVAGGNGPAFKEANKSGGGRIHASNLSMPEFTKILSRRLGAPVLDQTGLAGAYRVSLQWAAENKPAKPGKPDKTKPDQDRPSIFTALRDQLGLRLGARKAPVEILVIDHIDKTPTRN